MDEFPFAYCPTCDDSGPVVVDEVGVNGDGAPDELQGTPLTVIYCPSCMTLLNTDDDIRVEYYTIDELEKLGWKVDNTTSGL